MFRRTILLSVLVLFASTACSGSPSTSRTNPPTATTAPGSPPPAPVQTPVPISDLAAQAASFISAGEGWLLAGYRCRDQVCGSVLKTGDRGKSWSKVSDIEPTLGSNPGQVNGVRFADSRNGFLFGSDLLATHDGGAIWKKVDFDGPVVGVASGKGRTYAVVNPCYQSTDAGCTRLPELVTAQNGSDDWEPVTGFAFRPGSTRPRIAAAGDAVFVLQDSDPPILFGSPDGQKFARLNVPCPPGGEAATAVSIAATGPEHLAVLCGGGAAAGSSLKQVYESTDGGVDYRMLSDAPLGGIATDLAAATPGVLAMTAVSGASYLYRTGGGAGWTTALDFGDGGVGFGSLNFVDAQHGAVVYGPAATSLGLPGGAGTAGGRLYLCDDGGEVWKEVKLTG